MRHVARATFSRPVRAEDEWKEKGLCRTEGDPEWWFPEGRDKAYWESRAISVCERCPMRRQCRERALANKEEWGVWAGLTERQLRKLVGKAGQ